MFGYWHCISINRVLSGIENINRVFFSYIPDKVYSFGSTKGLAAPGPYLDLWSKYIKASEQFWNVALVEQ